MQKKKSTGVSEGSTYKNTDTDNEIRKTWNKQYRHQRQQQHQQHATNSTTPEVATVSGMAAAAEAAMILPEAAAADFSSDSYQEQNTNKE